MMLDWLDSVAGPDYARALLLTLLALVLLVIVLVVIKLFRSMTFGTFVAGGRNRKTRLAVMDATPVDSQRRLVLIRRDDTEHLLLIGGPTDLVVERDIRLVAPRRPGMTGGASNQPLPVQQPVPAQKTPTQPTRAQPEITPALAPQPIVKPYEPVATTSVVAPRMQPAAAYPAAPVSSARVSPPQEPVRDDTDDIFMEELSLDDFTFDQPATPVAKTQPSLDDEMAKLLGDLSSHKK